MDRMTTGVVATLVVGMVIGFVYALQPSAPTVATATVVAAHEATARMARFDPAPDTRFPGVGAVSMPKAPITRLSADRDLFATYRELKQSSAGGGLHVARNIVLTCDSINRSSTAAREVAAGRPALSKGGALPEPVQIDAAIDLLARCRGFDGFTTLRAQQALAEIDGRLARADDPVSWGESNLRQRRVLSDDQSRSMLASHVPWRSPSSRHRLPVAGAG